MTSIILLFGGIGACALIAFCVKKGIPFAHPTEAVQEYKAWRKVKECLDFDGSNGNIDLRMIGSIPLVRRAGIAKAHQSIEQSKEVQNFLGLNS